MVLFFCFGASLFPACVAAGGLEVDLLVSFSLCSCDQFDSSFLPLCEEKQSVTHQIWLPRHQVFLHLCRYSFAFADPSFFL
jgi:hypothetical protein